MVYDDDTSPRIYFQIRSEDRPITPVAEDDRPPTHIRALIGTLGEFAGWGPERVAATLEARHAICIPVEVVRFELAVAREEG